MTAHGFYIAAAYGLVVLGFGALVIGAILRQSAARRQLAELDPRGARS
jgi:heme exporter protein CcmD